MKTFEKFKELAEFIKDVKPSGSFSCYVRYIYLVGQPVHRVTWYKGMVCHHPITGRFMTWSSTGGLVGRCD